MVRGRLERCQARHRATPRRALAPRRGHVGSVEPSQPKPCRRTGTIERLPVEVAHDRRLAENRRHGSTSKDDFENMVRQFPAYDALYAFCRAKHSRK